MTILLVDDERPAIDALRQSVNWDGLGFSRVEAAYNAQQAEDIFRQTEIAVLLCDIEMPGGSGLELLQWVRTYSPMTVSLLFTCHADFDYAQRAVALGAFDYLLKPSSMAEVERSVGKAAAEWNRRRSQRRHEETWRKNRDAIQERFWLETVLGELPPVRKKLEAEAARRGLDLDLTKTYFMILCAVRHWSSAVADWQAVELDFAFKNILMELFSFPCAPIVGSDSPRRKFLLLPDFQADPQEITDRCQQFFDAMERYFGVEACFYIGHPVPAESLAEEYQKLRALERQNVSYSSRVYFSDPAPSASSSIEPLALERWQSLLELGSAQELCAEIDGWLTRQTRLGNMNAMVLELFYHDFLQMLYATLVRHHISAAQLWQDHEADYAEATASLEAMQAHLEKLIRRSCDYMEQIPRQNALVAQVKAYISEHLTEDLSRDLLARAVYLNPNYLSRLFHQQTGQSLVDYITHERMERVKILLRTTDRSVTEIAGALGYTNMPYFSRVFRKETGCSPVEYRRGAQTEK